MTGKLLTMFRFLKLCTILTIVSGEQSIAQEQAENPLVVFAAASLTDVLEVHASKWAETAQKPIPRLSFGPSGTLARQLAAGAPADMIISANAKWITFLQQREVLENGPKKVAGNSLVLVVPGRHTIKSMGILDATLLHAAIGENRLAIADPAVSPAGDYAKSYLRQIGLWQALEGQLAFGGSVRQTLLLAERGNMPALVYSTDARMSRMVTAVALAPVSAMPQILYLAGLTKSASPDAGTFLKYLTGDLAAPDWAGYGFTLAQGQNASN